MRNTGKMYISEIAGPKFVVDFTSIPEAQARSGRVKMTRNTLARAVDARNLAMGYDPDVEQPRQAFTPVYLPPVSTSLRRFAVAADMHLTAKAEALQELWYFYNECSEADVTNIFVPGNLFDSDKFTAEVHTWGLDNKLEYVLKHYPYIPGIQTHLLCAGDHEGDYIKQLGLNPIEALVDRAKAQGRTDLHYMGTTEGHAYMPLEGGRDIHLMFVHPSGGAQGTAVSGVLQRYIDGIPQHQLPDILVAGHFHKACYLPNHRGVSGFLAGCFEYQTDFMRPKSIHAMLGGWIITVRRGFNGRLRVGGEFLHYGTPTMWTSAADQRVEVVW